MRMPAAILWHAAILLLGFAMNDAFAQPRLQSMQPGDSEYALLLDVASTPIERDFGANARISVERLDRLGNWAFVLGRLQDAGGGPLPLANTRYAERAAQGGMSDVYAALLKRRDDDSWGLTDHVIGPGDVAWLVWPQEHGAPRALFGF